MRKLPRPPARPRPGLGLGAGCLRPQSQCHTRVRHPGRQSPRKRVPWRACPWPCAVGGLRSAAGGCVRPRSDQHELQWPISNVQGPDLVTNSRLQRESLASRTAVTDAPHSPHTQPASSVPTCYAVRGNSTALTCDPSLRSAIRSVPAACRTRSS